MTIEAKKWLKLRLASLILFFLVLFIALVTRAFQIQVLKGQDLKTRADRQLAEAQAEAEELIRRARSQADSEYAERRIRALDEVQGMEERRAQLADVITQLEARLAGYREDLTRTAEELTLLASDPDRLGARPTLSIPPDGVLAPPAGPGPTPGG